MSDLVNVVQPLGFLQWSSPKSQRSFRSVREIAISEKVIMYSTDEHLSKFTYWKNRYQKQSTDLTFDWFLDSQDILTVLLNELDQQFHGKQNNQNYPVSYLDLGCGTSDLAENILSHSSMPVSLFLLDFVHDALSHQKHKISRRAAHVVESSCHLVCGDVRFLPFCDSSFNMTVDKGTMDALLKDRSDGHLKAESMMSEVIRVMTPGGRFLQISDEDPDTRLLFLEELARKCCSTNSCGGLVNLNMVPDVGFRAADFELFTGVSDNLSIRTCNKETLTSSVKKLSFCSFRVIPSRWGREYFIFWMDKL